MVDIDSLNIYNNYVLLVKGLYKYTRYNKR